MGMWIRASIGIIFLLIQIYMIGYARFMEARYFCWAPFDSQNEYVLSVEVNGRTLTNKEIEKRYRRPPRGLDSRSIQHLKDVVMQYESTYAQSEEAQVWLMYTVNGNQRPVWKWPQK